MGRLLAKLSCINEPLFILQMSFSCCWFIYNLGRLRIFNWIFIIECYLIWRVVILFWNIIILINTETFIIGMNRTVCAWYDISSLIRLVEIIPIIITIVDTLIMVIYIWRTCVHLLATYLLSQSFNLFNPVLLLWTPLIVLHLTSIYIVLVLLSYLLILNLILIYRLYPFVYLLIREITFQYLVIEVLRMQGINFRCSYIAFIITVYILFFIILILIVITNTIGVLF